MRASRPSIEVAALVGLVCIALAGGVHKASAEPTRRPRVLVDRSHEWLFAYDDLGDRMLRPAGYDVVLCDATINTTERLQDFDIVVLLQIANAFDYSTAEIALLQEYVRAGGSVIVVGNSGLPVSDVAESFGFRFGQERCELPFVVSPRLLTVGGADGDPKTRPMSYVVKPPKGAETLISDQRRSAIAAMAHVGKGKVICFADDGAYWDFCAQRNREMRVPNTETAPPVGR